MSKITPEMKNMIEKFQCYVATADAEGNPNVAPKGSTTVIDEQTIAFAEIVGKKTYQNIKANPKVAVVVTDRETMSGYRFLGRTELITEGALYDRYTESLNRMNMPNPIAVVKITVEEIYDMSVRNPGGRIY